MASRKPRRGFDLRILRYWVDQNARANPAGRAHTPKDPLHPIHPDATSGTLTPAAKAAPTPITLEYKAVIKPARRGKFCLVRAGISTLPKAMAVPNMRVPETNPATPKRDRNTMPRVSRTRAPSKVLPKP